MPRERLRWTLGSGWNLVRRDPQSELADRGLDIHPDHTGDACNAVDQWSRQFLQFVRVSKAHETIRHRDLDVNASGGALVDNLDNLAADRLVHAKEHL